MKPEEFLKMYNDYKEMYYANKDKIGMEEGYKALISTNDLKMMERSYAAAVMEKYGPFALYDLIPAEIAKGEFKAVTNFKKVIKTFISDPPKSEVKDKLSEIYEAEKNKKDATSLYEQVREYLLSKKGNPDADKCMDRLCTGFGEIFNMKPEETTAIFDKLLTEFPPEESFLKNKDDYLSYYEKKLPNPLANDIENLLRENNDQDKELSAALEGASELMTDFGEDGFITSSSEDLGRMCYSVIDAEYAKYLQKNKLEEPNKLAGSLEPEELCKFYKKNMNGKFTPSASFQETTLKTIEYARKNGLVQDEFESKENETFTRVHDVFTSDGNNLKKAIKEKNKEDIKKYYKILSSKTEKVDKVIADLKTIDNKHLYNSNISSSRSVFSPARYRVDVEGTSLFNQMSYLSKLCNKYDLKVEEIFLDPEKAIDKVIEKSLGKDSDFAKSFRSDDPFRRISHLDADEESRPVGITNNDLIQLAGCLATNNPEKRIEYYHYIVQVVECKRAVFNNNMGSVTFALGSNNKLYKEVLPAMIMLGNDFDVFHMVNGEEPKIDPVSMTVQKDFNLKDYMKKHYSVAWERMIDKLRNAASLAEDYQGNSNYSSIKESLAVTGKLCSEVLCESLRVDKKVADTIISDATGEKPLSRTGRNTISAQMQFAECELIGNKGLRYSLDVVALLDRQYNKNGILRKIFSSEVHAQKAVLKSLKENLIGKGMKKGDLEHAIYEINHDHKETVDNYVDSFIMENEDKLALNDQNKVVDEERISIDVDDEENKETEKTEIREDVIDTSSKNIEDLPSKD